MKLSDLPTRFNNPFAYLAAGPYITSPVPATTATPGRAALNTGFSPLNFQPRGAGGIPPFGQDMNGLMFQTTGWSRWQAAGGAVPFDTTFQTAIAGYPKGAIVADPADPLSLYQNTTDDNTVNPITVGTGWVRLRKRLSANTTFYIATTGNDATGDGTLSNPWLNLQHAFDVLLKNYDLNSFQATVQVADGLTYLGGSLNGLIPGQITPVIVNGNAGTPTNVLFLGGVNVAAGGNLQPQNFKIQNASGNAFLSSGILSIGVGIVLGAVSGAHFYANSGIINVNQNYTISGPAAEHYLSTSGKINVAGSIAVTLTGTPAFSAAFMSCDIAALITFGVGVTFTGAATGQRFFIDNLSLVTGTGGSLTFLPGSTAGVNNGHGAVYN